VSTATDTIHPHAYHNRINLDTIHGREYRFSVSCAFLSSPRPFSWASWLTPDIKDAPWIRESSRRNSTMRTFAQQPKPTQEVKPASSVQGREASDILRLKRTVGNQAAQRLSRAKPDDPEAHDTIQGATRFAHNFSRITVSSKASELRPFVAGLRSLARELPTRDPAELEAERAADALSSGRSYAVRSFGEPAGEAPEVVRPVLASRGEPLRPEQRDYFEPRLGRRLSSVRVHRGATAERAADALGAEAFTFGEHVALGRSAGDRSFAHELAHAAQSTGGLHPRLLMTGTPSDVNALLALLGGPAGLALTWDPATHVVTATPVPVAPRSPSIRTDLLTIIGNTTQNAEVHAGQGQTNVLVGAFPTPDDLTGDREQHIDVDDLQAIETGAPGNAAVVAIHEIHENYEAHSAPPVAGARRFTPAHAASMGVESAASSELVQPGSRRVGDITSAAQTTVSPGVTAYQQLFDYGNYYLLLEVEQHITSAAGVTPRTSDQRVTRACRVNKVVAATHTINGFARNSATAPTSRIDAHYFAQDYYVRLDILRWDLHTLLAEGYADAGETDPAGLSQRRADAVRAWISPYSSPGEWSTAGRGVPPTPSTTPANNRKVVVTLYRPDPATCPAAPTAPPTTAPTTPTAPATTQPSTTSGTRDAGVPIDAGAPTDAGARR
jgi:hypothetical protein